MVNRSALKFLGTSSAAILSPHILFASRKAVFGDLKRARRIIWNLDDFGQPVVNEEKKSNV